MRCVQYAADLHSVLMTDLSSGRKGFLLTRGANMFTLANVLCANTTHVHKPLNLIDHAYSCFVQSHGCRTPGEDSRFSSHVQGQRLSCNPA